MKITSLVDKVKGIFIPDYERPARVSKFDQRASVILESINLAAQGKYESEAYLDYATLAVFNGFTFQNGTAVIVKGDKVSFGSVNNTAIMTTEYELDRGLAHLAYLAWQTANTHKDALKFYPEAVSEKVSQSEVSIVTQFIKEIAEQHGIVKLDVVEGLEGVHYVTKGVAIPRELKDSFFDDPRVVDMTNGTLMTIRSAHGQKLLQSFVEMAKLSSEFKVEKGMAI